MTADVPKPGTPAYIVKVSHHHEIKPLLLINKDACSPFYILVSTHLCNEVKVIGAFVLVKN